MTTLWRLREKHRERGNCGSFTSESTANMTYCNTFTTQRETRWRIQGALCIGRLIYEVTLMQEIPTITS